MKTGTPPRIDARTVDYSKAIRQDGETDFHHFSFLPDEHSTLPQRPCWIVYTNDDVHRLLRDSLDDSPLFNGQIQSIGPRYCPSIESKIVTFADKDAHQLFIEPEGADTNEMYLNGFSSSLPWKVQIEALHRIPALADAYVYRPGYAIEYDFFDPTQLTHTLESKVVRNLFLAGQVNGTTGYEEAAGQGLVAGVNAHVAAHGGQPFTLGRDKAYIGVLIDDLVTKGVDEPYRMFTSRAEHRILLRQDDADRRLTPIGLSIGLADSHRRAHFEEKTAALSRLDAYVRGRTVGMAEVNGLFQQIGETPLSQGQRLSELILRPGVNLALLAPVLPDLREAIEAVPAPIRDEVVETLEVEHKYAGYIQREALVAEKIARLENISIAGKFDYATLHQLSTEARQKLQQIQPETIGQASRIPGVSPSDINMLLLLLGR